MTKRRGEWRVAKLIPVDSGGSSIVQAQQQALGRDSEKPIALFFF